MKLKDGGLPQAIYHNVSHRAPSLNPLEGLSICITPPERRAWSSICTCTYHDASNCVGTLFAVGHSSQNSSILFHAQKNAPANPHSKAAPWPPLPAVQQSRLPQCAFAARSARRRGSVSHQPWDGSRPAAATGKAHQIPTTTS